MITATLAQRRDDRPRTVDPIGPCHFGIRNRFFSLIIGGLNCLQIPFGTALCVFTILVLSRDSVRQLAEKRASRRVCQPCQQRQQRQRSAAQRVIAIGVLLLVKAIKALPSIG